MGIFISIGFSKSLTQKEWEPVYEETLKLAEAFPFAETRREEINGISTYCLARTKERTFTHRSWGGKEESYVGWCAVRDYQTMRTAEDHMLVREFVNDEEVNPDAGDVMMEFLPSYLPDDFDYDTEEHDAQWDRIWDGKNTGRTVSYALYPTVHGNRLPPADLFPAHPSMRLGSSLVGTFSKS